MAAAKKIHMSAYLTSYAKGPLGNAIVTNFPACRKVIGLFANYDYFGTFFLKKQLDMCECALICTTGNELLFNSFHNGT